MNMTWKNHLRNALLVSALTGMALVSCDNDLDFTQPAEPAGSSLSIVPYLMGMDDTPLTRAEVEGNDALRENYLGQTIDVFVQGVTDNTFWRQYHVVKSDGYQVEANVRELLRANWRADGYKGGEYYDVYVAVNNEETTNTDITSLSELLALTQTNDDIFKQYNAESNLLNKTTDKAFAMSGKIESWTPNPESSSQTFNVSLERVAAKIEVEVVSKDDFYAELTEDGYTFGDLQWKYGNFNFRGRVFGDSENLEEDEKDLRTSSGGAGGDWYPIDSRVENGTYTMENGEVRTRYKDAIVTYTYPSYWGSDIAQYSPFLLLRLPITDKNGQTSYYYYRVPLTTDTVQEIKRNHLYKITAIIASWGSSTFLEDTDVQLEYEELPWKVVDSDASSVAVDRLFYLMVNPLEHNMYGSGNAMGTQTIDLDYFITEGYTPTVDVSTLTVAYTGVNNNSKTGLKTSDDDPNGITTDLLDRTKYTYDSFSPTGETDTWYRFQFTTTENGETIPVENFYYNETTEKYYAGLGFDSKTEVSQAYGSIGQLGGGGYHMVEVFPDMKVIRVTSRMLINHSIKTISFDVFSTFTATINGESTSETITRSVVIHHYPIDEINAFYGAWSSRWIGTDETWTTYDENTAKSWGVEYTTETGMFTEYVNYSTYNSNTSLYTRSDYSNSVNQSTWENAVPNNSRNGASSETNSYFNESDGYSYWRTSNWNRYTYYRVRYSRTYTTRYTGTVASTGKWVDYAQDNGQTYSASDVKYNKGNNFTAHVYNKSDKKIYAINVTRSGYNNNNYSYYYSMATSQDAYGYYVYTESGNFERGGSRMTSLTNNRMYVIEITATSSQYVIGHPNLTDNLSKDHVVSPAFMIASQLGATQEFTGDDAATNAATHCGTYMEVGTDEKRYTNWRLPTREEIGIILGYQFEANSSMVPVLTGDYYWTLEGKAVKTGVNSEKTGIISGEEGVYMDSTKDASNSTGGNVRCIRDLTQEDLARLRAQQGLN